MKNLTKNIFSNKIAFVLLLTSVITFNYSCGSTSKKLALSKVETNKLKFEYLFSEAGKQTMLGNDDDAVELYLKCLNLNPKSAAANFFIAKIYEENNKLYDAFPFAQKAVSINSENYWYKILEANILKKLGKLQESSNLYSQIIDKNPELEFIYFDLLALNAKLSQTNQAIKNYHRYEKHFGITEETSMALYDLFVYTHQFKKAENTLKKLTFLYPDDVKYPILLAELFVKQNKMEQAKVEYQKLLLNFPAEGNLQLSYAFFCKILGDKTAFLAHTKIAFSSDDVAIETKIDVLLAGAQSDFTGQEFENILTLLIDQNPENQKLYLIYAEFLLSGHQKHQAAENYRYALNIDNSNPKICLTLLSLDSELQDFKALLEDSEPLLDIYPNQPIFFLYHGSACFFLKNYTKALKSLTYGQSLVFEDDNLAYKFLSYLADTENALRNFAQSDLYFERLIKINPKDFETAHKYAFYLAKRNEKLNLAEQLIRNCLEYDKHNALYYDTFARVLFRQNKLNEAEAFSNRAVLLSDKNAGILEFNGDVLFKLKKYDQAKLAWQKALFINKKSDNLKIKTTGTIAEIEKLIF